MPIGSGQGFVVIDIELWRYLWASFSAIVGLLGIIGSAVMICHGLIGGLWKEDRDKAILCIKFIQMLIDMNRVI